MNDVQTAKSLGWFSLVLGATELIFGRRVDHALELDQAPGLVRAFGAREVAAGALVLMYPDTVAPIWVRVVGDVLDLVVLGRALSSGRRPPTATLIATFAVVGVTALDVATGIALTRRHSRALSTARRSRVSHRLSAAF